jgi:hypothetical protein
MTQKVTGISFDKSIINCVIYNFFVIFIHSTTSIHTQHQDSWCTIFRHLEPCDVCVCVCHGRKIVCSVRKTLASEWPFGIVHLISLSLSSYQISLSLHS